MTNTFRRLCQILIVLGILGKFYGITDPWKTRDHYNYGGIWTTTYAECLKMTPLAVSKGIPHSSCWTDTPTYYTAHPPTLLFALWGWTSVFGNAEWAYRLFFLMFSSLNIGLVYLIARKVREGELFPWLAAALQATFLGGLYFGTHPDFIGEFTVFFVLLTGLLALCGRLTSACLTALLAGISAWPGYIVFAPLWAYTFMIGRGRKRVFFFGALGILIATGEMMWLNQTWNILDFARKRAAPKYIGDEHRGYLKPFFFLTNFVMSQARLLGPLFASFALFEWFRGDGRPRSRKSFTRFHAGILLAGGTGLVYALLGPEYVMVHVFLYLLMVPGFALLGARFIEKRLDGEMLSRKDLLWFSVIAVLVTAMYPYGIFQSNFTHDVVNSILLIGAVLTFLFSAWKSRITPRIIGALMCLAFIANFSQMTNYRNEPDTQRSFCDKARAEYKRTGQPVHTTEEAHPAKVNLYCRDFPIIFDKAN